MKNSSSKTEGEEEKSKVIFNKYFPTEDVVIQNEVLERLIDYVFLNQLLHTVPSLEPEMKKKTDMTFRKQISIVRASLHLCLKRKVYNQWVIAVITYRSETWTLTKSGK